MGFIVPLYHPLRLAEEIAIVDQMLGGCMKCGLVPGISADYFKPFGIDYNFRKSPTIEFVDYLQAAYGETQPFRSTVTCTIPTGGNLRSRCRSLTRRNGS